MKAFGIITSSSDLHFSNADSPIFVTVDGIVILINDEHS